MSLNTRRRLRRSPCLHSDPEEESRRHFPPTMLPSTAGLQVSVRLCVCLFVIQDVVMRPVCVCMIRGKMEIDHGIQLHTLRGLLFLKHMSK